jgi:hypothetical protein
MLVPLNVPSLLLGELHEYKTATLHDLRDKPRRYSMECGSDVHCITVMPNKEVHFHNHPNINDMVHLVTFDILQNPEIANSKLDTCHRVLRGLRTGAVSLNKGYRGDDVVSYTEALLSSNLSVKPQRQAYKLRDNPKPWREEVLGKYKAEIGKHLKENLKYYGMNGEGYYKLITSFDFCLAPKFTPSAVMSMAQKDYGRQRELNFNVTVSPKWLINVWLKGRAIVEGVLILSVEKEYPNGTTLCLAAKQSHGFKIKPKIAVVDFERQVVSWVNDEDKKHELVHEGVMPRVRRRKKELTPPDNVNGSPVGTFDPALLPVAPMSGIEITAIPSYDVDQLKVIGYRSATNRDIYHDGVECKCADPNYKNCHFCNDLNFVMREEEENV